MSDQLPMRYDTAYESTAAAERSLVEVRRVVSAMGMKEVAFRLQMSPSLLAHKLAERNNNHLSAREQQAILAMSGDQRLADAMVAPGGFKVVASRPLTAEQKLARLEAAVASMPELMRKALLEQAGLT